MAVITVDLPLPVVRTGNVAYALSMAASVGVLTFTILLAAVAGLASGTIGLFGLPPLGAWIAGSLGTMAAAWVCGRLALSAYRVERAGIAPREGSRCLS